MKRKDLTAPRQLVIDHPLIEEAWFYNEEDQLSLHIAFKSNVFRVRIGDSGCTLEVPFRIDQINFAIKKKRLKS